MKNKWRFIQLVKYKCILDKKHYHYHKNIKAQHSCSYLFYGESTTSCWASCNGAKTRKTSPNEYTSPHTCECEQTPRTECTLRCFWDCFWLPLLVQFFPILSWLSTPRVTHLLCESTVCLSWKWTIFHPVHQTVNFGYCPTQYVFCLKRPFSYMGFCLFR